MKIYSIVEYINGKGQTKVKMTTSAEDEANFLKKLDLRIERGTCSGYITTTI